MPCWRARAKGLSRRLVGDRGWGSPRRALSRGGPPRSRVARGGPVRRSRSGEPGRCRLGLLLRGEERARRSVSCSEREGCAPSRSDRGALGGLGQTRSAGSTCRSRAGVDAGFASLIHEWAKGRDLSQVLQPTAGPSRRGRRSAPLMSGGDFVRNVKQVIDLLRQVAVVAHAEDTARSARSAAERLLRDVVAASSVVTIPVERGTIRAGGHPAP